MTHPAPRTLLLGPPDLRALVEGVGLNVLMDELIQALTVALRELDESVLQVPKREGFQVVSEPRPSGVIGWMPALRRGDSLTVRVASSLPTNRGDAGLPTLVATHSVYDVKTGHLAAVMDGVFATALRTGAASAVASRYLASPDSRVLGLVGCGAQAVSQLHALSRVFRLEQVLVHDIDADAARSFVRRVAFLGLDVRPTLLPDLEMRADILCTATTVAPGAGPVISGHALQPHAHVNAVGADQPGKAELPLALLRRSLVVPDFPAQARLEGECQQLHPDQIGPDLATVVQQPEEFEGWRERNTVFDSTGHALEDHVVTRLLLEHARRMGLGTLVALESLGGDPLDPYGLVRGDADGRTESPRRATGT
ncbi:ornithine cyclodeaminase family protein [Corallococcus exercitus]|uniref:Ornithine cyclodeaminase family protein n=1 Tax=Corallococcus exercitus TaxID=2316736 RepID=A0A3A8IH36_9BACT|nr:ornithine cyclodeaminase family protein [Corallococcus exercitus]NOK38187.1 ornithine cyclodeaminase family protein [Corallococcus exercitus]RKG77621.1 ornithine cyclodeaminase family protein [Corallococcus exercitus]